METKKELQYDVVKRLLFVMKKFWYILLLIVIVSSSIGIYSYYNGEISYTVKERVVYNACDKDSGTSGYNYSVYFYETAIDFVFQKCVLDRANYYYEEFAKTENVTVEEYIEKKSTDPEKNKVEKVEKPRISVSRLRVEKTDDDSFVMEFYYNDANEEDAKEKVKILIFAAGVEATTNEGESDKPYNYKYFEQAKISYIDKGLASSTMVNSAQNQPITFFAVGIIVSVIFSIIMLMSKRSITEACELEFITKASVLDEVPVEKGGNE
ncbi:MAG: hypothetical protein IKW33_03840 [Clostridia bacterium]|nr:hypothetical protein [Clostridia bacterium]